MYVFVCVYVQLYKLFYMTLPTVMVRPHPQTPHARKI